MTTVKFSDDVQETEIVEEKYMETKSSEYYSSSQEALTEINESKAQSISVRNYSKLYINKNCKTKFNKTISHFIALK